MTKIASFNRTNIKEVRKEVEAALSEIGDKLGIALSIGTITFRDGTFTTRLSGIAAGGEDAATRENVNNEDDNSATAVANSVWNRHAPILGFQKDDFGKTVNIYGTNYKIVGIKPSARKNNILLAPVSGAANRVAPHLLVLAALNKK
jgi:hypothetical protein